jgi:hypothetical protein
MSLRNLFTIIGITLVLPLVAQQTKKDTVKIPLGKSSQILLTIGDKSDIETLKHYDFQELFSDVLRKLENPDGVKNDTTPVVRKDSTINDTTAVAQTSDNSDYNYRHNDDDDDDDDEDDGDWEFHSSRRRWGRTWQSFNFDLGTNNWLQNGSFPDRDNAAYAVRPWGSWYIAMNSTQRSRLGRNFFLEWAAGVSWYTFKFQNSNTVITRDDNGIEFLEDSNPEKNYTKSKLGITFINLSLVPVLDFGDHSRKPRMWNGTHSSFRIGLGPYVGYRISSLSKVVYKEDGDKEKDKDRGNFYLNNLRYGARLQLGFRSTDFFFNYDLNDVFTSGRGPQLNAFSFGVIF